MIGREWLMVYFHSSVGSFENSEFKSWAIQILIPAISSSTVFWIVPVSAALVWLYALFERGKNFAILEHHIMCFHPFMSFFHVCNYCWCAKHVLWIWVPHGIFLFGLVTLHCKIHPVIILSNWEWEMGGRGAVRTLGQIWDLKHEFHYSMYMLCSAVWSTCIIVHLRSYASCW